MAGWSKCFNCDAEFWYDTAERPNRHKELEECIMVLVNRISEHDDRIGRLENGQQSV
jgi:hypothetical protein